MIDWPPSAQTSTVSDTAPWSPLPGDGARLGGTDTWKGQTCMPGYTYGSCMIAACPHGISVLASLVKGYLWFYHIIYTTTQKTYRNRIE